MSWQLGAFAVLGIGLLGGFAWYERTRPDARIVALVGTLAAFGALGRVAFAAVPNVKPTGDIVLISGYALGGAPGFVVGAVSALTSNFFFGQGPWTPWQMAGWGVTGVLGAGLAVLTRGRVRRLPLAIVCFVLGFGFTAFQDFGRWLTYSNHSLAALGLYVGSGVGFDLIYASGCLLFALAFGPALVHALRRVRQRLTGAWLPLGEESSLPPEPRRGRWAAPAALLAIVVVVSGLAVGFDGVHGASARAAGVGRVSPQRYLFNAENRDGGVGLGPHQSSSTMVSGWAALALAVSPGRLEFAHAAPGRPSLIGYLRSTIHRERDPGSIERTVLALRAAGVSVGVVNGVHLLARLRALIAADGSVEHQTNLTAFAVLALRAAGAAVPHDTIVWLARQEDGDGGFNFASGGKSYPSDPDDTGAAIEALAHTAHTRLIARAVAYLRAQQNRDGGFPDQNGGFSDSQSTAFVAQGLLAAGIKLNSVHTAHGRTPLQYLRRLTRRDGAIDYAAGNSQTPVWVTAQAQLALAQRTLPIIARAADAGPSKRRPAASVRLLAAAEKRDLSAAASATKRFIGSLIGFW